MTGDIQAIRSAHPGSHVNVALVAADLAALRDDMKRDPGYATANVVRLTVDERETLHALWHAAFPHGEYGARGCALCRREAHRVSARFPEGGFSAVDRPEGEQF